MSRVTMNDPRSILLRPHSSRSRVALTELLIEMRGRISATGLKILDIGIGGDPPPSANYYIFRDVAETFHTMDFEAGWQPTFVHDITKRFDQAEDKSYDLVLICETLEHIYDFRAALSEINRISRSVIVTTPFRFEYHQSPDDFWRFTHTAMARCLSDAGYRYVRSQLYNDGESTWGMAADDLDVLPLKESDEGRV